MQVYKAIKYIRLSYTDDKTVESDSVANQRRLIDDYIARHPEIEVVAEKIDDGYSGVLFDRPAFQEMMQMIKGYFQALVFIADFHITIDGKSTYKIPAAPFYFQGTPCLNGNIPTVSLIHNVFDRNREIIGSVIFRVHIIVNCDKTHSIGWKYPAHITACFYVLTT